MEGVCINLPAKAVVVAVLHCCRRDGGLKSAGECHSELGPSLCNCVLVDNL